MRLRILGMLLDFYDAAGFMNAAAARFAKRAKSNARHLLCVLRASVVNLLLRYLRYFARTLHCKIRKTFQVRWRNSDSSN